jgi:hypothetical protein
MSPEKPSDEMDHQSNEQPIGPQTNAPDEKDQGPYQNEKEFPGED